MFSELVDMAVGRSGRSSRFLDTIAWARATIRDAGNLAFFADNMLEDTLTPTADPYIWTPPANFRKMRTVKYQIGDGVWPEFRMPGKAQRNVDYLYYRTSNSFAFKGIGNQPVSSDPNNVQSFSDIDIAYYVFIAPLAYYPPGPNSQGTDGLPFNLSAVSTNTRPAIFDRITGIWSYLQAGVYVPTLGSTVLDEAAQALVSNWILQDWYDLAVEGTLAKLYKSVGDPRSQLAFSLYSKYQEDLKATGTDESLDY